MEDADRIEKRFELLKIARALLTEDYINKRAEDHNKWVAENEIMWRTKRRNIPYPPFAQYPTDEEIVKTASTLYNFIYMNLAKDTILPVTEDIEPKSEKDGDAESTNFIPLVDTGNVKGDVPQEHIPSVDNTADLKISPEPILKSNDDEGKTFLPGWMRRIPSNK